MAEDASARERNLALLDQALEAYNSGDLGFVLEHAAPDIRVHAAAELANAGTYQGRDEFERWMRQWLEAWRITTIEIEEVIPVDERYLLIDVRQRGEGAGSGVEVEMELTQLVEIRDGLIARFELHATHEDAAAALERLRDEAQTGADAD